MLNSTPSLEEKAKMSIQVESSAQRMLDMIQSLDNLKQKYQEEANKAEGENKTVNGRLNSLIINLWEIIRSPKGLPKSSSSQIFLTEPDRRILEEIIRLLACATSDNKGKETKQLEELQKKIEFYVESTDIQQMTIESQRKELEKQQRIQDENRKAQIELEGKIEEFQKMKKDFECRKEKERLLVINHNQNLSSRLEEEAFKAKNKLDSKREEVQNLANELGKMKEKERMLKLELKNQIKNEQELISELTNKKNEQQKLIIDIEKFEGDIGKSKKLEEQLRIGKDIERKFKEKSLKLIEDNGKLVANNKALSQKLVKQKQVFHKIQENQKLSLDSIRKDNLKLKIQTLDIFLRIREMITECSIRFNKKKRDINPEEKRVIEAIKIKEILKAILEPLGEVCNDVDSVAELNKKIKDKINKNNAINKELTVKNEKIGKDIKILQVDRKQLQNKIKELELYEPKNRELTLQLSKAKDLLIESFAKKGANPDMNETLEKLISFEFSENEKVVTRLQEINENQKEKINQIAEQIEEEQKKLKTKNDEIESLQAQINEHLAQIEQARYLLIEMLKKKEEIPESNEILLNLIRRLESKVDKKIEFLQNSLDSEKIKLETSRKLCDEAAANCEQKSKEILLLQEEVNELAKGKEKLTEYLEKYKINNDSEETLLDHINAFNDFHEQQCEEKNKCLLIKTKELEEIRNNILTKIINPENMLIPTNNLLKALIQKLEQDLEAKVNQIENARQIIIEELKRRKEKFNPNDTLSNLLQILIASKEDLQEINNEIMELKKKAELNDKLRVYIISSLKNKGITIDENCSVQDLHKQLVNQDEIDSAIAKTHEDDAKKVKEQEENVGNLQRELRNLQQELKDKNSKLEKEIANRIQTENKMNEDAKEYSKNLEEFQKEYEKAQQDLKEANSKLEEEKAEKLTIENKIKESLLAGENKKSMEELSGEKGMLEEKKEEGIVMNETHDMNAKLTEKINETGSGPDQDQENNNMLDNEINECSFNKKHSKENDSMEEYQKAQEELKDAKSKLDQECEKRAKAEDKIKEYEKILEDVKDIKQEKEKEKKTIEDLEKNYKKVQAQLKEAVVKLEKEKEEREQTEKKTSNDRLAELEKVKHVLEELQEEYKRTKKELKETSIKLEFEKTNKEKSKHVEDSDKEQAPKTKEIYSEYSEDLALQLSKEVFILEEKLKKLTKLYDKESENFNKVKEEILVLLKSMNINPPQESDITKLWEQLRSSMQKK